MQRCTGFALILPKGVLAAKGIIHFLSSALADVGDHVPVVGTEGKMRRTVPYRLAEVPLDWGPHANLPTHVLRGFASYWALGAKLEERLRAERLGTVNFHSQFYSLCNVFAISSEFEVSPTVVLEAIASGKAVVASDVETLQKHGRKRKLHYCSRFDHRSLAEAIVSLL